MKTKITKTLSAYDVRKMCIRNEWYTHGNNEDYSKMLNYVDTVDNWTESKVLKVAKDIVKHSNNRIFSSDIEFMEVVLFEIYNNTMIYCIRLENE